MYLGVDFNYFTLKKKKNMKLWEFRWAIRGGQLALGKVSIEPDPSNPDEV